MRIILVGPESNSITAALEEANIEYKQHSPRPQPGVIMNARGDAVQLIGHAIPWASVATVFVAWLRARASRKIIVTTKDNKVVHIEGYSVEQFEQILAHAREVIVVDTKKSEVANDTKLGSLTTNTH